MVSLFRLTLRDEAGSDEKMAVVPPSSSPFITKAQPRKIERVVDQSKRVPFANTPVISDSSKVNPQRSKSQAESVIVKVRGIAMTKVMPGD